MLYDNYCKQIYFKQQQKNTCKAYIKINQPVSYEPLAEQVHNIIKSFTKNFASYLHRAWGRT